MPIRPINRFLAVAIVASSCTLGFAADPAPVKDEVAQQASQLEAELGKVLDTTPEGGAALLKLIDLYYKNGRVFGLVTTAQRYINAHASAPETRDVMLKLLDGLVATSRQQQAITLGRQFLTRYPTDPAAVQTEQTIADALGRSGPWREAAEASEAVWRRGGPNAARYGAAAISQYNATNDARGFADVARIGEEMIDKLPAGPFAADVAITTLGIARRYDHTRAAAIGRKIVAKNLITDKAALQSVLAQTAESSWNVGQSRNAADALRAAVAIKSDEYLYYRLAWALNAAGAKPDELEPVANDYMAKFPQGDNRFSVLAYLAQSFQRSMLTPQALATLNRIIGESPRTENAAACLVEWTPADPAAYAATEKMLLDAVNSGKGEPGYLRAILASRLYRDRMKDLNKAHDMAVAALANPADEASASENAGWLFGTTTDDGAFRAVLAKYFEGARQGLHVANYWNYADRWATEAAKVKEQAAHAAIAKEEFAKFAADPIVKLWAQAGNPDQNLVRAARAELSKPENLAKLSDGEAWYILNAEADAIRNEGDAAHRVLVTPYYTALFARFPKNGAHIYNFVYTAGNWGTPEMAKLAVQEMLTIEPPYNGEVWRQTFAAAVRSGDAALVDQTLAWIAKAQAAGGVTLDAATEIMGYFDAVKRPADADAYAKSHYQVQPERQEARNAAERLLGAMKTPEERAAFLTELLKNDTPNSLFYAQQLAEIQIGKGDVAGFIATLNKAQAFTSQHPFTGFTTEDSMPGRVFDVINGPTSKMPIEDKLKALTAMRDALPARFSATAAALLLDLDPKSKDLAPMPRLLAYRGAVARSGQQGQDWDSMMGFAQAAMARKDYPAAATLLTAMVSDITQVDAPRTQAAREMIGQAYARMGGVGLTIDENSPYAALLKATLYLRLGDHKLAFETYDANKELFDKYRSELPLDLILFVADSHITAGGDANHERAEDILRGWLVKFAENKEVDDSSKAKVQLLLARNYFKAGRFEVSRSEFNTVVAKYPTTPEATDAEFGIGESFMAQKIYDQAEAVFEKLANSRQRDVTIRAEFLRGVLAYKRGDKDEARKIFTAVLERVPDITLADKALYNLSEVYGDEQRHIEQLELLRTIGRLGRESKRWHTPGNSLAIVVQDSDLGISRGHTKIPVIVTTDPGGDKETIYLTSGGAGKGLFRADIDTRLGDAKPGDGFLEITGKDTIRVDYPEDFKKQFRSVPLPDAEIKIGSDAKFEVGSGKILDEQTESFSQKLEREARERENQDNRRSQGRPKNQIKPGNPIYLRVIDFDRDLTAQPDTIRVKVEASSGDQVQAILKESGPHTGIFEASIATGELPAGAVASDSAIDHGPLLAIDHDPKSTWLSTPDGATPKWLTVDMKDLKKVDRVLISTPDPKKNAPVRTRLQGSHDGRFWFTVARYPQTLPAPAVEGEFGAMTRRVFRGVDFNGLKSWDQIVAMTRGTPPVSNDKNVEHLDWKLDEKDANSKTPHAVVWQGKIAQVTDGALRFHVEGANFAAIMVDGIVEMDPSNNLGVNREVDVWLDRGVHTLTIYAGVAEPFRGVAISRVREDVNADHIELGQFRAADFDLGSVTAAPAPKAVKPGEKPAVAPVTPAPAAAAIEPVVLPFDKAILTKKTEKFGPHPEENRKGQIGYWQDPGDFLTFDANFTAPGMYEVFAVIAHEGDTTNKFSVEMGDQKLVANVPNTGSWDKFAPTKVGVIRVEKAGVVKITMKPEGAIQQPGLLDFRQLDIRPSKGEAVVVTTGDLDFHIAPRVLRHVRVMVDEYIGDAVAISNIQVSGPDSPELIIPTKADVLALSKNDSLEIASGDTVTASYTDEFTGTGTQSNRVLTSLMTATYHDARIHAINYDFVRHENGTVENIPKELARIDPGERISLEVTDYDMDTTPERDQVPVTVRLASGGEPISVMALETLPFSGVFRTEIDTTTTDKPEAGKLAVKAGDVVVASYLDKQNTFPGHAVPRETTITVTKPTQAKIRVIETRFLAAKDINTPPQYVYLQPRTDAAPDAVSGVAYEVPLTVEVIDPDAAKDSRSSVIVNLKTTDGVELPLKCMISDAFAPETMIQGDNKNWPLEEGRFVGQVVLQLGGKESLKTIPLTSNVPRNLIGGPKTADDNKAETQTSIFVLNLTGKDRVLATYDDKLRPEGKPAAVVAQAHLIATGSLSVTDRDYEKPMALLHVGEKLFLVVSDPDLDVSDARDKAKVHVTTARGEDETVELEETLTHSGVFAGSFSLKAVEKPTPNNFKADAPEIETFFGDTLTATYSDQNASTETGKYEAKVVVPIAVGTDGLVGAFSKVFRNEDLAVQTQFHIAESYFELFKSHLKLGREEETRNDLESGRRVLKELMEDYPNPQYIPRVAYLQGQFAQELKRWPEAIDAYSTIVRQYPDNTLAADAQYKLAQCYEEANEFAKALEAYVTLAATYPKSPLIANVMIRINEYFYRDKNYVVAAQVGLKFLERFETHAWAPKMAFRIGQCYSKAEQYDKASAAFDLFVKKFPDDPLAADSLFWAGESYRQAGSIPMAFRRYNRCRWDFPESDAAKYARGRLALPEMLQQFESEATQDESK
jgi:TolA-binding protein